MYRSDTEDPVVEPELAVSSRARAARSPLTRRLSAPLPSYFDIYPSSFLYKKLACNRLTVALARGMSVPRI